jgi:mono/diheme cytochrome c family protein
MQTRNFSTVLILLSAGLLLLVGCRPSAPAAPADQAQAAEANDEHHEASEMGHDGEGMAHQHAEVPHEFEDLTNPFAGDAAAIAAGQAIFETSCAVCHGPQGKGDGPGSAELNPKPADLSDSQMMSDLTDGYLFWRVSEGGQMEPFNSAMPPWKAALSEEQRWQVISFIRSFTDGEDNPMGEEHHEDGGEHHEETDE